MEIEVKQKRPISFGIKVGVVVIAVSIILGVLLRIAGKDATVQHPNTDNQQLLNISNNILVPVILLPINTYAHEKEWTDALARQLNGRTEVQVDRGRVDVMTDTYAIEIDFVKKWHEGLGQAIHYGDEAKRIGVLALIDGNNSNEDLRHIELLKKIERLCIEKSIKLIFLRPTNGSSLVDTTHQN